MICLFKLLANIICYTSKIIVIKLYIGGWLGIFKHTVSINSNCLHQNKRCPKRKGISVSATGILGAFFTFMWPWMVINFFVIKPTRCTNLPILFCHETLHVSDISSVLHQELFTVHSAVVYIIRECRKLSSRTGMELSSILVLLESYLQT